MLEGAVAAVLQKALGAYLEGIDSASLRASVWDGDIVLREVSLRTSALEALQLPVRVLGGSVGVVRVQVPWRKLRTDPIVINIEGLWLLLAPQDSTEQWDAEGERLRKLAAMKQRLEVWEEVEAKKNSRGVRVTANPLMLAMVVSICSNVDSFFALSFASTFTPGSIVAFLLVGPLVDVKMLALLRTTFTTRTLVGIVVVVIIVFLRLKGAAKCMDMCLGSMQTRMRGMSGSGGALRRE